MNTSHGELFVTPINDHLDAHQALTSRKVYERGLNYTTTGLPTNSSPGRRSP
ncbi:MAG TPA: hypothetical protein VGE38_07870 [Nocardioides sp.]|uniref:hypothetical protein n=1 Tax=Nocardioides sp. TaxID=35761 RepID=UPI002EDB4AAF